MKKLKDSIKNLTILILLIIISFLIIFKNQNFLEIIRISLNAKFGYIILGILAMTIYLLGEAVNIKIVFNTLGKKLNIIDTFKYSLVGFFFSGITPSASGGQPMEIYTMHKDGLSVAHSTLALLIHICCYQVINIIFGIIGAIINHNLLSGVLVYLFILGTSLNVIALSIMLVCLLSPKLAQKLVNLFIKILKLIRYKNYEKVAKDTKKTLESYSDSSKFIKRHKVVFLKTFGIMAIQMFAYYSIPFFVYKSFGLNEYGLLSIISIEALLHVSVSSMPLPGAVGVSEGAFLKIYEGIFGTIILPSAMLLNRGINFYMFIFISLLVVAVTFFSYHNINEEL